MRQRLRSSRSDARVVPVILNQELGLRLVLVRIGIIKTIIVGVLRETWPKRIAVGALCIVGAAVEGKVLFTAGPIKHHE